MYSQQSKKQPDQYKKIFSKPVSKGYYLQYIKNNFTTQTSQFEKVQRI